MRRLLWGNRIFLFPFLPLNILGMLPLTLSHPASRIFIAFLAAAVFSFSVLGFQAFLTQAKLLVRMLR